MAFRQPKYSFGLLETPLLENGQETSISSVAGVPTYRSTITSSSEIDGPRASSSRQISSSSAARTPQTSRVRRTPYLSTSTTPAACDTTSVIIAIVEGRGLARGEVGMASIDLKQPVLVLSQFADTQTYAKLMSRLHMLQPIEILMPNTTYETGNSSVLLSQITSQYSQAHVTTINRKYFNEETGLQFIKDLCLPDYNTVEITVKSKYYCLATVSALLKYVEFIQNVVYMPASLRVIYTGSEHTTMIDVATVVNLEMLRNARGTHNHQTLYAVMNNTKTRMGARLLRANILQPPCDLKTISTRLDIVEELTGKRDLFTSLQSVLGRFLDIDHLLSMCIQVPKQETIKTADSKISAVIYLKHTAELSDSLRQALSVHNVESSVLKYYAEVLSDPRFKTISEMIGKVVHDDTRYARGTLNMKTQKCFAVKPGINGLLDVARRSYSEIIDDINELVKQVATNYGMSLKTSYTSLRGFHIQLGSTAKDGLTVDNLPAEFMKVTKTKNLFSFTTAELIKFNDRMKESINEIYIMSNSVLTELLSDIRQHLGCLYELSNCIATLDMLVALAHNRTLSNYTKPEFTDTLAIKNGRHPVLDKTLSDPAVPNNTFASNESNFVIITGPNMSGKSTYLRQIVLLQIMAQIGSFVPAEYASFRLADQIFTRIGSDDDIKTNASTFTVEMREIAYITQNATNSSLIIIDELGRGTSVEEGFAMCHAICEHIQAIKAFTFFATHFTDLTSLASLYPNVENYHFEVKHVLSEEGRCDKIYYTHIMSRGKTQEKHYGLRLAQVSGLPREIIEEAKEISHHLTEQRKRTPEMGADAIHERAVFKLAKQLEQTAVHSRLDEVSLRSYLKGLKEQFLKDGGCVRMLDKEYSKRSSSSSELEE